MRFACFALLLAAPAAAPVALAQGLPEALERPRWALVMWNSAPETRERPPDLKFSAGRVAGFVGCNTMNAAVETGPAEPSGTPLRLREIGLTKRLCEGPPLHAEERYLAALRRVRRFTLAGDRLILEGERNLRLVFVARPASS
jgi:heat shock protein HslJ